MITTNDERVAATLRLLRNHGQRSKTDLACFGFNSRLDNLQAAILLVNLQYLEQENTRRRWIAQYYHEHLRDLAALKLPLPPTPGTYHDVYNSYVVRTASRDALHDHLAARGIEAMRHWDPPLHQHPGLGLAHCLLPMTERLSREVLSLPIYPGMRTEQLDHVIGSIRAFFAGND
jgi:dTDP-4-amino-4,6-dideoxygalactose transaminase